MEKIDTIDVLGTEYTIYEDDPTSQYLNNELDGVADPDERIIVISTGLNDRYYRRVLRHEIIHAFLYESGLETEMMHPETGHDEQFIDWLAVMWPRIDKVYDDLKINY